MNNTENTPLPSPNASSPVPSAPASGDPGKVLDGDEAPVAVGGGDGAALNQDMADLLDVPLARSADGTRLCCS